jgi:SAM-dependent methyltransferase
MTDTAEVAEDSDTSYESDDGIWHPPLMNDETGLIHTDVYGTLSATASTITTPSGVCRRFLEMIGPEKMKTIKLFVDIGCGKGLIVSAVAQAARCRALGIDILEEQLSQARAEASKNDVAELCEFVCGDFRQFCNHLPIEFEPNETVFYLYLIPKMVSNRELSDAVTSLLERGATFVSWQYHAEPSWPYLAMEDKSFGIKIFQRRE